MHLNRCLVASAAFDARGARWLGAISREDLEVAQRIALTVREHDQRIIAVEVDRPVAPARSRRLMPGTALLPLREARAFGTEERARVEQGVLHPTLICAAGERPAGAVFALGVPSQGADVAVKLEAAGDSGFQARLIGGADSVDDDAGPALTYDDGRHLLRLAVPAAARVSLALTCPRAGGRLLLQRVEILSARIPEFERPGAWVWSASRWRDHPDELLASAKLLGLGRLFISVEIGPTGVLDADKLADFVQHAGAEGVAILAVEGDPEMVNGTGRLAAIERARSLAAYQSAAPAAARLFGVQYDIEPYLLEGFAADPAVVWQDWSDTLTALAAELGERIEAVVPYWIVGSPGAADALASAEAALKRVTIMAYRTAPADIVAAAEPVLAWAGQRGIPVSVALESGPLRGERRTTFAPAISGELRAVPLGDVAAILLFDAPRSGTSRSDVSVRTFRFSHSVRIDPTRISFFGHSAAMTKVAADVSRDLAAWPVVRGLAFHGLAQIDRHAAATVEEQLP